MIDISTLLVSPAPFAFRHLALSHLTAAREAVDRVTKTEDSEAVHDFRVALRRLHTLLKLAYADVFQDTLKWRQIKAVKALVTRMNRARDLEVRLAHLKTKTAPASPKTRRKPVGLQHLEYCYAHQLAEIYSELTNGLPQDFCPLAEALQKKFSRYQLDISLSLPEIQVPTYASTLASLAEALQRQLLKMIKGIEVSKDRAELHRIRVRVKQLRYLLEPLSGFSEEAKGVLTLLKDWQGHLGTWHDRQVDAEALDQLLSRKQHTPDLLACFNALRDEATSAETVLWAECLTVLAEHRAILQKNQKSLLAALRELPQVILLKYASSDII